MIKSILFLVVLGTLFLIPFNSVAAEGPINWIPSEVKIDFPNQAEFALEVESEVEITDVRLCYQVDKMNYAKVVSEGWAHFVPGKKVKATWVWDMRNASLPPGAEVSHWWLIEDASGNTFETPPEIMHFHDYRYEWRSCDAIISQGEEQAFPGARLALFWYKGDDSFANELMNTCLEGLARLAQDIGAYPEKPIKIYVYASTADLQGAMVFSHEWTGGVAFAQFGVIAISIPTTRLDWGKKALVHELTHLVVHQATFSPYAQLPTWLDEGLAMYNEGELDPFLNSYLQRAIVEDSLISVRTLCSPFSAEPEKAYLSYAQSYSLVKYLLTNYGQEKMLDLLSLLKEGYLYDEALAEVYGFDIDGLDARWRATLVAEVSTGVAGLISDQSEHMVGHPHPALIAMFTALAIALFLWGALTVKGWDRRKWDKRS